MHDYFLLERLIGVHPGFEGETGSGVNEGVLRHSLNLLKHRTTAEDFDRNFTIFNAISLLPDYVTDERILDDVDSALENYILTCRRASEADHMLCDLLIDHWPIERALTLSRTLLERCTYRHRVLEFASMIEFIGSTPHLRQEFRPAFVPVSNGWLSYRRAKRHELAQSILRALPKALPLLLFLVGSGCRPHVYVDTAPAIKYQARDLYLALVVSAEDVSKGAVVSLDTKSPGYLASIRPLQAHLDPKQFHVLEQLPGSQPARIHTNPSVVGRRLSELPKDELVMIVDGSDLITGCRADGVLVYKGSRK